MGGTQHTGPFLTASSSRDPVLVTVVRPCRVGLGGVVANEASVRRLPWPSLAGFLEGRRSALAAVRVLDSRIMPLGDDVSRIVRDVQGICQRFIMGNRPPDPA